MTQKEYQKEYWKKYYERNREKLLARKKEYNKSYKGIRNRKSISPLIDSKERRRLHNLEYMRKKREERVLKSFLDWERGKRTHKIYDRWKKNI